MSAGQAKCHQAEYPQGELYLKQGLEEVSAQGGPKALNYSVGSLVLAECILAQQEDGSSPTSSLVLAQVRQLLTQVDLNVVESFPGTSSAPADLFLTQARLAVREGDVRRSRELVAKARPLLNQPNADPWEIDRLMRLERALSGNGR